MWVFKSILRFIHHWELCCMWFCSVFDCRMLNNDFTAGVLHLNADVLSGGLNVSTPKEQISHQLLYVFMGCRLWPPSSHCVSSQFEQLYRLGLCSKEDCMRVLTKYQWNLELASRYLIRWSREGSGERERPQVSTERRVWSDFSGWLWINWWTRTEAAGNTSLQKRWRSGDDESRKVNGTKGKNV